MAIIQPDMQHALIRVFPSDGTELTSIFTSSTDSKAVLMAALQPEAVQVGWRARMIAWCRWFWHWLFQ